MLMSTFSIARYLPPDPALFDVAIFGEASQITTWNAGGAIARGHQTVMVGNPKQLPPTNFFGQNEDDEEVREHERDLEASSTRPKLPAFRSAISDGIIAAATNIPHHLPRESGET